MHDQSTTVPEQELTSHTVAKPRRLLTWCALSVAVVSLAASAFSLWYLHKLKGKFDDLSFSLTASDYNNDNNLLSPDIGVIQFMHRGYSITFDTLSYTASGLEVTGTLGNPNQLTLSSVNLKLSARPFLYKNRDKIVDDPFFLFNAAGEIGSGQTSISYLGPGKTATFSMTIPNVKQTSDGFQIAASISGERYSYY
jgi:hypothetical protein